MLLFFLRREILTPLMLSWFLKTWSTIIWVLGWKFKIWYQKQLSLCNVYLWYFDNRYEFIYINFFHEFLEVVCFALKSVTQLNAQYKQLSRWPFFYSTVFNKEGKMLQKSTVMWKSLQTNLYSIISSLYIECRKLISLKVPLFMSQN